MPSALTQILECLNQDWSPCAASVESSVQNVNGGTGWASDEGLDPRQVRKLNWYLRPWNFTVSLWPWSFEAMESSIWQERRISPVRTMLYCYDRRHCSGTLHIIRGAWPAADLGLLSEPSGADGLLPVLQAAAAHWDHHVVSCRHGAAKGAPMIQKLIRIEEDTRSFMSYDIMPCVHLVHTRMATYINRSSHCSQAQTSRRKIPAHHYHHREPDNIFTTLI